MYRILKGINDQKMYRILKGINDQKMYRILKGINDQKMYRILKGINDQKMHFNLPTYFYCITVANMFRSVTWPSSWWFLW
jgi:DNA-binding TFAR19-related protein (PDSD5 family)